MKKILLILLFVFTVFTTMAGEKENFDAVSKRLQDSGNFYLYLSTEEGIVILKNQVLSTLQVLINNQDINANEKNSFNKGIDFLSNIIGQSGLTQIDAIGMSSKKTQSDLYENRFFMYHSPEQNKGKLWTVFGEKPHKLEFLNYLPDDTVVAGYTDIEIGEIWKWISKDIDNSNILGFKETFQGIVDSLKVNGISLDDLTNSIDGGLGVVFTMSKKQTINIPVKNNQIITIPTPAFLLAVKVKDKTILNLIESKTVGEDNTGFAKKETINGEEYLFSKIAIPFIPGAVPVITQKGSFLFIASDKNIIASALDVNSGKNKGLIQTPDFKELSKDIPLTGNAFKYCSPELGGIAIKMLGDNKQLKNVVLNGEGDTGFFAVSSILDDGIMIKSHSGFSMSTAIFTQLAVIPAVVAGSVILPIVEKNKIANNVSENAERLKVIGAGCEKYAKEHKGLCPGNINELSGYVLPEVLINANGTPFEMYESDEPEASEEFSDILIIDDSVSGYTNVLYTDGEVETLKK